MLIQSTSKLTEVSRCVLARAASSILSRFISSTRKRCGKALANKSLIGSWHILQLHSKHVQKLFPTLSQHQQNNSAWAGIKMHLNMISCSTTMIYPNRWVSPLNAVFRCQSFEGKVVGKWLDSWCQEIKPWSEKSRNIHIIYNRRFPEMTWIYWNAKGFK